MPDQTVVNIPRSSLDEMLATGVKIAEIEAQAMVRGGNIGGATAHIAAAVQQSAAMRTQILAAQPAPASAVPQQPPPTAPEVPGFVQNPRSQGEAIMARIWNANQQRKAAEASDPRHDMTRPYGLTSRR